MTERNSAAPKATIWINGNIATMNPQIDDKYGLLEKHAIITEAGKIKSIIPMGQVSLNSPAQIYDLRGALVTPGFIDCHTHLIFGGNRAHEWEMRLDGISYQEIAAQGGGINSTVKATREASFECLYESSLNRLKTMMNDGVTTVEVKSGYGLNFDSERKMLLVAQALRKNNPVDISPTLLAAHSVPPEFSGRPDDYIEEICSRIMPGLWQEKLFEAVDIFVENIAFNIPQTEKLFNEAQALGIAVKAHSEQMSNMEASSVVAKYSGLSTDHIEHLSEKSIRALASSRTVASLLPMAFYFLKDTNVPPIDLLRQYKVPMAVATDFNPGTSPFTSIRMAMNMASTLFRLTPSEALAGVTRNAAKALGRENSQGQLKEGFDANFVAWNVDRAVEIFYEPVYNPMVARVFQGRLTSAEKCSC